ncbi:ABC transporter substrate-binding protein [Klugiella xanthotipulae]|uniref:Putative ABC transport system substrate-binding protein n=1 Tax=Klugiella xanthotipulae TaxID=244735 RepID=A0A543HH56_9MICO|nr:ABC transporter substrate-binding protein [Klugiella xanthotipulae]TQM57668.1 putative ABC transport system substrate-binding protein [Klugiella xanthotipulae]
MLTKKSLLSLTALGVVSVLALSGCSDSGDTTDDGMLKIGITQLATHPSLDAVREGFKAALSDNGYVEGEQVSYDEKNAQGEQANAVTIAGKFATDDLDLVLAIATQTAQTAAQKITKTPVLFSAVTDPVVAGLVTSLDKPGGNVTGTSDLNPVADQIQLIADTMPEAEKVGVIYSSGEVNSQIQVDLAKKAADKLGLTIVEKTITNSSEVGTAASTLKDVDALYIPTDNRVVEGFEAVIKFAETNSIPVFAGDVASVERGAVATYGIDYEKLGYQTGEMAVKILKDGAKPADLPVETMNEVQLVVNPKAAARQGLDLSETFVDGADEVVGD